MWIHKYLITGLLIVVCYATTANAQQPAVLPADNPELKALFAEGNGDRNPEAGEINWDLVNYRDADRRDRVREILRAGEIRTALDYYHAAAIFQHGKTADELRMALSLAWIAATADPSSRDAMFLSASAFDRLMKSYRQAQWYGTQADKRESDGRWELYPVRKGAVSDAERKRFGLPSLEEIQKQIESANSAAGQQPAE